MSPRRLPTARMPAAALVAIATPTKLGAGAVLTKPSPVLQFEPAALESGERAAIAKSVARREVATPSSPIPVIQRIVQHTLADAREVNLARTRSAAPARADGRNAKPWTGLELALAALLAVTLAAGLGALAGFTMRAVTPEAATLAR